MLLGKKSSVIWSVVTVLCLSCFSGIATAATFDDLMAKVREQAQAEAQLNRERESEFRAKMEEQNRLYRETLALRNEAEALSNSLIAQIEANRIHIDELEEQLRINEGNLGELFGVTRQIAGDAAGELDSSLVNSQIATPESEEDRVEFMLRIASATALPSIAELERLWLELLEEIRAGSETVRYTAPVLLEDGITSSEMEVVRIASFMAFADNKYLGYLPSENMLTMLSRQPPQPELMALARSLQNSSGGSGYVEAVVDPTQGALLGLFVERPNLFERIAEGEAVGYVIVAVGLIGTLVAAFQYVYLFIAKMAVSAQLKHLNSPTKNNALGRMLLSVRGDNGSISNDRPEVVELRISEAVLREIPKLERFQAFLRLAVAAGPLLGLIGTVIGMIITFESITASGSSDPKLMAQGIGQAMIATVLGLGVAIPLLFLNAGLVAMSRSVVHVLEEQSTSLMAARLQQDR